MLKKGCLGLLLILMAAIVVGATPAMAAQEGATATQETTVQAETEKAAVTSSGKVNICTASAAELEKLPGIGAKTAEEIVLYREKNGPFNSTEDLKKVKGIGEKKFEALKDKITVQ